MNNESVELEKTIFSELDPQWTAAIDSWLSQIRLAIGLVARLRGANGCPWDREQNHLTLRPYLIEEAYEVLEILDRYVSKQDPKELARKSDKTQPVPSDGGFPQKEDIQVLCEELGDLLLQVLLHSQLAFERGDFHFGDVGARMAAKLVGRHPHVFGNAQASNSEQVLQNWEALKKKEGKGRKSILEGLPKNIPSLQRAARIGEKAHRVGFDWKDWQGAWAKVEEELKELKEAIDQVPDPTAPNAEIEHELGDIFFALCNLSRHLKIQPEDSHRKAISRFEDRFRKLEVICEQEGIDIQSASLETLDEVWERVKKSSTPVDRDK